MRASRRRRQVGAAGIGNGRGIQDRDHVVAAGIADLNWRSQALTVFPAKLPENGEWIPDC